MKNLLFPLFFFATVLLVTGTVSTTIAQDHSDYLETGLNAEQSGNYETALEIWFQARQDLENPSLKIATEYLRVATEQDLNKYYQMAYAMYLWGLSAESIDQNYNDLALEIERLKPITSDRIYNRWRSMLSDADPNVQGEILKFWNDINILPLANYNPRIIEHWARIAYARENFAAGEADPYGTDIRGVFYVRYGPPNKQGKMDLEISLADIQTIRANLNVFTGTAYEIENSSLLDAVETNTRAGTAHIWIYDTEEESEDLNLTLVFREMLNGEFERIIVIDDLILSSAFRGSGETGRMIQMVYYNKLRTFDPQFASIYFSMESDYYSDEPAVRSIRSGKNFKFLNRARAQSALKFAPPIASTDRKTVSDIPIDIRQYRALNEHNEPILITYVQNRPMEAFYLDIIRSREGFGEKQAEQLEKLEADPLHATALTPSDLETIVADDYINNYQLRNTLHLRSPENALLTSATLTPVLVINDEDEHTPSVSVFDIPHLGSNHKQIFFAELRNNDPESTPYWKTSLPNNLRGLGSKRLYQPDHFTVEPGKLLASDLIIGFQKHEELLADDRFPFIVSNDGIIPQGEPLVVHFEVYQLGLDDRNFSLFEVEYEFRSVSRFFNLFGRSVEGISSTLTFEHDNDRFVESLEIETGNLGPGEYDLNLTLNDKITDQTVKRSVRFELVEEDASFLTDSNDPGK